MLPFISIPLLHSSGTWIASTAAGGYIAGTLSTTWIGAFVAGNATLLSALGITSAAGVYAALGGALSSAGTAIGGGLTAVGLSGLAQSIGLAPETFLGLTFISWAAVASAILIFSGLIFFSSEKKLQMINVERRKGDLPDTTWIKILHKTKNYEKQAMMGILKKIAEECKGSIFFKNNETVKIKGVNYNIRDLKYVVKKNGAEMIVLSRGIIPFYRIVVYTVKSV
jgi:hypothetical protein